MGIAVLSGVIDNLDSPLPTALATATGMVTPVESTTVVTGTEVVGGAGGGWASQLDSMPDT